MDYGSILKFYRTKLGITQRELALGICSITHLSKIENNNYKEVNEETLETLFNRLGVSLKEIKNEEKDIFILINKLIEKINFYEKEEAELTFSSLLNLEQSIEHTEYLNIYLIYKYRYMVFIGKFDEAIAIKEQLLVLSVNFSQKMN